MGSTPGGTGRSPVSPARPTLQDQLAAANAQPFQPGQQAAPNLGGNITDAAAQPDTSPDGAARLKALEQENEQLKQAHERMRGQVSQRHKAEEEERAKAASAQAELVESQRQLAEAMSQMANANRTDPNALTEEEISLVGQDYVGVFSKMMDARTTPLLDEIAQLRQQLTQNTQNITANTDDAQNDDRIRLITAQQTMQVHPDVQRARAHPQFATFKASQSVDMPTNTYEQLIDAYHEFGQSDAYVNIHSRFLDAVEPKPVDQPQGFGGMIPPHQNGARPDMNRLSGGGSEPVSEHLTPQFQEMLKTGERTMEDFNRLREEAARKQPQLSQRQEQQPIWTTR